MKVWMDSEFMENGATQTVIPLSIAMVASNDQALYLVITDADRSLANPWVVENVIPYLDVPPWGYTKRTMQLLPHGQGDMATIQNVDGVRYIRAPRAAAGALIAEWVAEQTPTPEFWAWYGDYDWVALCQLHGSMVDLPERWPKFCNDLRQVQSSWPKGLTDPQAPSGLPEHHALADAYEIRAWHQWYIDNAEDRARKAAERQMSDRGESPILPYVDPALKSPECRSFEPAPWVNIDALTRTRPKITLRQWWENRQGDEDANVTPK